MATLTRKDTFHGFVVHLIRNTIGILEKLVENVSRLVLKRVRKALADDRWCPKPAISQSFCVEREDDTQNKEEIDGVYKTKNRRREKKPTRLYK